MRSPATLASLTTLSLLLLLAGCDSPTETPEVTEPVENVLAAHPQLHPLTASGGGHFDAGVKVQFSFSAVQRNASGDATGRLHFTTALGDLPIEFHGRVSCMTVDLENRRAWIGGVVTQNRSEHPSFTGDIHQPGRDIWFRLVDYGEGAGASQPDRITFVGFEGSAGIITTPEYCEARIWPDGDERTGPLLDGNIRIR